MENYYEMIVNVAINTHKEPLEILVVFLNEDEKEEILKEIKRYDFVKKVKTILEKDLNTLNLQEKFDLIISYNYHDFFTALLKEDGVAVIDGKNYFNSLEEHKEILKNSAKAFYIAMPFVVYLEDEVKTPILLSKKYHPTADINLQRAELMDGLRYYNSDIHVASFAKPTYIAKELLGIAKN